MYYSAPGSQPKAAIGMVSNKTLDPDSPDYRWEDGGPIVWSDGEEDCNAIDPVRKWLPEDHLALFISDMVDNLDLSEITDQYAHEKGGHPAYHPAMMVKLLFYGYCRGITASREIERETYEDVAFRVLSCDAHPDHSRISDFRKRHLKAIGRLFLQVLEICQAAGMVRLGRLAVDGTKLKANASKHKAMSYGRMKTKEVSLRWKSRHCLLRLRRLMPLRT